MVSGVLCQRRKPTGSHKICQCKLYNSTFPDFPSIKHKTVAVLLLTSKSIANMSLVSHPNQTRLGKGFLGNKFQSSRVDILQGHHTSNSHYHLG